LQQCSVIKFGGKEITTNFSELIKLKRNISQRGIPIIIIKRMGLLIGIFEKNP